MRYSSKETYLYALYYLILKNTLTGQNGLGKKDADLSDFWCPFGSPQSMRLKRTHIIVTIFRSGSEAQRLNN